MGSGARRTSAGCQQIRRARAASRSTRTSSTPHTDEITANLRRLIFTDTVAGIDYTWKRMSNIWDGMEINQIWDPSGQRVVDWVDPPSATRPSTGMGRPKDNHRTYQGFDIYFEGSPTPKWDFNASYTLSWLYGPGITEFDQIQGVGQVRTIPATSATSTASSPRTSAT